MHQAAAAWNAIEHTYALLWPFVVGMLSYMLYLECVIVKQWSLRLTRVRVARCTVVLLGSCACCVLHTVTVVHSSSCGWGLVAVMDDDMVQPDGLSIYLWYACGMQHTQ